jgi:hypothetical protein
MKDKTALEASWQLAVLSTLLTGNPKKVATARCPRLFPLLGLGRRRADLLALDLVISTHEAAKTIESNKIASNFICFI